VNRVDVGPGQAVVTPHFALATGPTGGAVIEGDAITLRGDGHALVVTPPRWWQWWRREPAGAPRAVDSR
jgi:hypothetical protein